MYPRNAASPEPIAIGAVVQISDGAVQTSGCTVRIKPIGVAEGDGGGTTAYSTDGIVLYTPTQAETNYTSFILIAKKTGCIPACVTVVTTASSVPGRTMPADGSITAAVIATDAIDADAIKADAVTEIQSGLATATNVSDAQTAIITQVDANETKIDAVKAKTDNLPSDPADQSAVEAAITAATSPLATAANLATVAGYLDTEIADILADTNELQAAWADGGRLDLILDARSSQASVDDLPTNAELATALGTADDAVLAAIATVQSDTNDIQTRLPAALESGRIAAALDSAARVKLDGTQPDYAPLKASDYTAPANSDITAIKAKTDNLPSDPADQSLIVAATDAILTAVGDVPTNAELTAALGTGTWATALPWNAAWDAEVQSEVQDAIEVNNLDHLVKIAVDTNFATTVHLNSVIGHMADNGTTATFSRTTDSLEAIRDNQAAGSGASLPDIIAGVQSVSGAIIEAQNSATLSIRIGDTWTQDVESLGDLTDKTVCFALKKRASDADTAAIVFIVEGTGLTRLNGATTTAGWGSITILDEVAGDIRLRLESNATALLTSGSYVDAVKVLEDGDDRSPRNAGRTVVSAGVIADIT
jgi:hypothetical protein